MRRTEVFQSKYLKAADLNGADLLATIASTHIEELGDERERKCVVYFTGDVRKGLVCNMTNFDMISAICGSDDTDTWVGRVIVMFPTEVAFKGRTSPAIRVKAPAPPRADVAPDPVSPKHLPRSSPRVVNRPQSGGGLVDDEIPFGPSWQ